MIEHRPYAALGGNDLDWLKARLHVAFAGLGHPRHAAIGPLEAWNDDEFAPGSGFGMHRHQDLEIITYVRRGAITHEDSLGNRSTVVAGDVQAMSAGSGISGNMSSTSARPAMSASRIARATMPMSSISWAACADVAKLRCHG
jgi:redox-sensitive bicupin YhaK (pirin superfamily)